MAALHAHSNRYTLTINRDVAQKLTDFLLIDYLFKNIYFSCGGGAYIFSEDRIEDEEDDEDDNIRGPTSAHSVEPVYLPDAYIRAERAGAPFELAEEGERGKLAEEGEDGELAEEEEDDIVTNMILR